MNLERAEPPTRDTEKSRRGRLRMNLEPSSSRHIPAALRHEQGIIRGWTVNIVLLAALITVVLVSFTQGKYALSIDDTFAVLNHLLFNGPADYDHSSETVFLQVRVPRLLSCVFVGAALSVAGASYQGIFKNPLVSPDLLGASSGSAFGACVAILLGTSYVMQSVVAFAIGVGAVLITYAVSSIVSRGENSTMTMILTGMVVTSMFNAGVSLTKSFAGASDAQLSEITFWLMGSMTHLTFNLLPTLVIPVTIGIIPIILLRYRLNVLSFGEEEAETLGLDVRALRIIFIACATLVTSAATATCGIIGWIGLVIPHLLRMLIGPDYRTLIPASLTGGALFLLCVDNVTRVFFQVEISIGILTAIVGAPFFLFLLVKGRKGWV